MYKSSDFNILVKKENDNYLLYNTFRHGLVEIDDSCKGDLLNINKNSIYVDTFLDFGFWIPENADELEEIKFTSRQAKFNDDTLYITLKLTNACNFKCVYCYQSPENKEFDSEKMSILKKFIKNQRAIGKKKVSLHFFGGEPLMNKKVIKEIAAFFNEESIAHEFTMTSNGYLLNDNVINLLKNINLKSIQITLDGIRESHDKSRILLDGRGTFDVIVNNIKKLITSSDIKVVIRYNITKINSESIDKFMEMLSSEGLLHRNVELTFNEAVDLSHSGDSELFFESREAYSKAKLVAYNAMMRYGIPIKPMLYTGTSCAFDKKDAFVITPDLKLEYCTSSDSTNGKINSEGEVEENNSLYKRVNREAFEYPKCKGCKLLPICMGGCALLEEIHDDACLAEKYILEDIIRLYDKSEEGA